MNIQKCIVMYLCLNLGIIFSADNKNKKTLPHNSIKKNLSTRRNNKSKKDPVKNHAEEKNKASKIKENIALHPKEITIKAAQASATSKNEITKPTVNNIQKQINATNKQIEDVKKQIKDQFNVNMTIDENLKKELEKEAESTATKVNVEKKNISKSKILLILIGVYLILEIGYFIFLNKNILAYLITKEFNVTMDTLKDWGKTPKQIIAQAREKINKIGPNLIEQGMVNKNDEYNLTEDVGILITDKDTVLKNRLYESTDDYIILEYYNHLLHPYMPFSHWDIDIVLKSNNLISNDGIPNEYAIKERLKNLKLINQDGTLNKKAEEILSMHNELKNNELKIKKNTVNIKKTKEITKPLGLNVGEASNKIKKNEEKIKEIDNNITPLQLSINQYQEEIKKLPIHNEDAISLFSLYKVHDLSKPISYLTQVRWQPLTPENINFLNSMGCIKQPQFNRFSNFNDINSYTIDFNKVKSILDRFNLIYNTGENTPLGSKLQGLQNEISYNYHQINDAQNEKSTMLEENEKLQNAINDPSIKKQTIEKPNDKAPLKENKEIIKEPIKI